MIYDYKYVILLLLLRDETLTNERHIIRERRCHKPLSLGPIVPLAQLNGIPPEGISLKFGD